MLSAPASQRFDCRVEGRLPAPIAGQTGAICRMFRDAVGGRSYIVTVRFHRPDSVSARIAPVGKSKKVYPEVTVSQSDRAIGMDTIEALARAIAGQMK